MVKNNCESIDEFISYFGPEIRQKLETLRNLIREVAPDTEESISYQIPTFKLKGKVLVHFSAYKTHIGFYPTPNAIIAFKDELSGYKTSKGTIQFTHEKELPIMLIRKIVEFRAAMVKDGIK
jgi:uncharacterized protein YdhG (YjbR/CyaY superfamily)